MGRLDCPAGGPSFILEAKLISKEINFYKVYSVKINKNNKYMGVSKEVNFM